MFVRKSVFEDGKIACIHCSTTIKSMKQGKDKRYWCGHCRQKFSLKQCTPFKHSRLRFLQLLDSLYFFFVDRSGNSSVGMSKKIGVCQSTAWLNGHKIRRGCDRDNLKIKLSGKVAVDEGHVAGRGRWFVVMAEMGCRRIVIMLDKYPDKATMDALKIKHIEKGSTIVTDMATYHRDDIPGYTYIRENHKKLKDENTAINKKIKEHNKSSKNKINLQRLHLQTDIAESIFSQLRRVYSTHRKWNKKNDKKHIDEVVFRLDEGSCKIPLTERIANFFKNGWGKSMTRKSIYHGCAFS